MSNEAKYEYDISVVVIAHAEGRLTHRTMRSIEASIVAAQSQGLRCEIIIVLNCPASETLAYLARWRDKARILEVANSDPGLKRNAATEVTHGKSVVIIYADALFGRGWLVLAHKRAELATVPVVAIHAEITNYFGNRHELTRQLASDSPALAKSQLFCNNQWTFILFAPLVNILNIPFLSTPSDSGYGFEDWHWVCEVIASEGKLLVAPESCNFMRYKSRGSRLSFPLCANTLLHPTKLFEPSKFLRRCVERDQTPTFREGTRPEGSWSNRFDLSMALRGFKSFSFANGDSC